MMATAPPGFVPEAPPDPAPPPATGPPPSVPMWRKVVGVVLGLLLIAAAVYAQSFVIGKDRFDDPLTVSGGMRQELATDLFSARLERVEAAKIIKVRTQYGVDEDGTDDLFLVVKIGATAPRRPIKLDSHLITADGLRFNATDRVPVTATLSGKWVQSGWWRSGFFFFEIPRDKIEGARVVVSQLPSSMFGDQYAAEASFDLGLDPAEVDQLARSAGAVYEVNG